jgi:dolichol kinase
MAKDASEDGEAPAELKPSELDENTHAEMRELYGEVARGMRFAKERQWKLVGAVLLVFVAMMVIAQALVLDALMAKGLALASFLVSAAAIYMLVIYQIWQNTEGGRLEAIGSQFSNLFREIVGLQNRRDSRLHGYIILTFMIFAILLGNAATVFFLARFYM